MLQIFSIEKVTFLKHFSVISVNFVKNELKSPDFLSFFEIDQKLIIVENK